MQSMPLIAERSLGASSAVDLPGAEGEGSPAPFARSSMPPLLPSEGIPEGSSVTARSNSFVWPAVLRYGEHVVTLDRQQYKAVRGASGLLRAWVSSASRRELHTVLRVPGFDDAENAAAVRCV